MKKVTLFFCDIRGTFDCGKLLKIDDNEVKRLADNLSQLNQLNGTDFVIYTFVTAEHKETVDYMENYFKQYASNDIQFGHHIYSTDEIEVSKATDIFNYIEKIATVCEVNSNVYYADDTEFYHFIIQELNEEFNHKYEFHSIIPKEHGLKEVNDEIEEQFIKKIGTRRK